MQDKIVHPSYDKKDGNGDIAILVLAEPISFTRKIFLKCQFGKLLKNCFVFIIFPEFISPVCLPLENNERTRNFVGFTPFAAGWGKLTHNFKSSFE